jgi:chemotaxis protein MotB
MLHDIEKMLQGRLPVTVDEENGTMQLGSDFLFPRGSANIYAEAEPKLRILASALDAVLPCYAVAGEQPRAAACEGKSKGRLEAVYIEGHTDTAPIRTSRFWNNWDLSAARASETLNKLVDSAPALGKLGNDRGERLIGVSGYGEFRPVDDAGTEEGMQKNRRIELRFIMVSPQSPEISGLTDAIRQRERP